MLALIMALSFVIFMKIDSDKSVLLRSQLPFGIKLENKFSFQGNQFMMND